MDVIVSAIYDVIITIFGVPADTGMFIANLIGGFFGFFIDLFGFLGGLGG